MRRWNLFSFSCIDNCVFVIASKYCLNVYTNLYACPFDAGWNGGVAICFIPIELRKMLNLWLTYCVPLTVTRVFGNPYLEINGTNSFMITVDVIDFVINISGRF